jgi:hypothetical protein
MRIRFNVAALRQTRWHEILTRFLLGGAITVATGVIAQHWGPVIGGLFLAFPAILPSGATLIEKHEREKKRRAGIVHTSRGRLAAAVEVRGAAMGSVALAAFGFVIWRYVARHNAAGVLAAATAVWVALAVLAWRARKLQIPTRRSEFR